MAVGWTTTGSLADSMPTLIASARQVREQKGGAAQLCDHYNLDENTGGTWNEISLSAIEAQGITENTELDNAQQLVDTLLSITPAMVGIHTFLTDKLRRTVAQETLAEIGGLAQNAIQRYKDKDVLTAIDGATTSLGGAGVTLTSGYISAAVNRIGSNTTEEGEPPYYCVLHGFQIRDIANELTAPVGTYEISSGVTAEVFRTQFQGQVGGAQVFRNGNITIDSSDDAKGGVFAKRGLVLIESMAVDMRVVRNEKRGGGGEDLYLYTEYAIGERSAGNWLFEIYSDATAPTS